MAQKSMYCIYGVRLPDETDHLALEDKIGQCNSQDYRAGVFTAGMYDNNMIFLAVTWEEKDPGDYTFAPTLVGGFDEARYAEELDWNHELMATVRELKLEPIEGPGWFTIFDES